MQFTAGFLHEGQWGSGVMLMRLAESGCDCGGSFTQCCAPPAVHLVQTGHWPVLSLAGDWGPGYLLHRVFLKIKLGVTNAILCTEYGGLTNAAVTIFAVLAIAKLPRLA